MRIASLVACVAVLGGCGEDFTSAPPADPGCTLELGTDFENALGNNLTVVSTDGTVAVATNSVLRVDVDAGVGQRFGALTTVGGVDMTERCVHVEVLEVPDAMGTLAALSLGRGDDDLGIYAAESKLYAVLQVVGAEAMTNVLDYDAKAHRWWRIWNTQGAVLWQTSQDKQSWTTIMSAGWPWEDGTAGLSVGAGTQAATLQDGRARFDNLNR